MDVIVRIPDELAEGIDDVERRAIEALALEQFRRGQLSRAELRSVLGFETRAKVDEFLTAHGVFGTYSAEDLERDRRDLQRLGL